MIKDLGCEWVVLGHSERRHVFGEKDEVVILNFKAFTALPVTRFHYVFLVNPSENEVRSRVGSQSDRVYWRTTAGTRG